MEKFKGFVAGLIPLTWWLAAKWGWIGLWKVGSLIFTSKDVANFATNFISMIHVWIVLTAIYELAIFIGAIELLVKPWYRHYDGLVAAFSIWGLTLGWIIVRLGWHLCDIDYDARYLEGGSSWAILTGFGWLVVAVSSLVAMTCLFGGKEGDK